MANYFMAFDISASGMDVQKMRVETVALNLANMNTTRTAAGGPYQPLHVVISERGSGATFNQAMEVARQRLEFGATVAELREEHLPPRLVYEPGHPDADEKGFVAYPNINPVTQMMTLIESTRAYEANVRALNAAKTMALRALEIGEQ